MSTNLNMRKDSVTGGNYQYL